MSQKLDKKIFELYHVLKHNFCDKMFQYFQIIYTLKALLSKNWCYLFFLIFWQAKFHYIFGCHAVGINSALTFLLSAFLKFNMPSQKSGTNNSIRITFIKIIIKIIFTQKDIFVLKIPISSQQNMTLSEFPFK